MASVALQDVPSRGPAAKLRLGAFLSLTSRLAAWTGCFFVEDPRPFGSLALYQRGALLAMTIELLVINFRLTWGTRTIDASYKYD